MSSDKENEIKDLKYRHIEKDPDNDDKPLISFSRFQERQEYNEQKIKFQYARKERQVKLNVGKTVDPEQDKQRLQDTYQRDLVLDMSKREFFAMKNLWYGFDYQLFPPIDDFDRQLKPSDPNYYDIKPIAVTVTCSSNAPFLLDRCNAQDLNHYITEMFGTKILYERSRNKLDKTKRFDHVNEIRKFKYNLLALNEITGQDHVNKNAFNVYATKLFQFELNNINKRNKILGLPELKPHNALMKVQGTINKPSYYLFENGEL